MKNYSVVVNPQSSQGKALSFWNEGIKSQVEKKLNIKLSPNDIHILDFTSNTENQLKTWIKGRLGTSNKFISISGDGGIHHLVNALIRETGEEDLKKITVGAVGMGSSNDFHKPNKSLLAERFPARLSFENTIQRDIGLCRDLTNNKSHYLLINASLGLTAHANHFFNSSSPILKFLQKANTNVAINYAALSELIRYKNQRIQIKYQDLVRNVEVSNLVLLKQNHFAGNFYFKNAPTPTDGNLALYVHHGLSKLKFVKEMQFLEKGIFNDGPNSFSSFVKSLEITAKENFIVELDGETFSSKNISIETKSKILSVCKS